MFNSRLVKANQRYEVVYDGKRIMEFQLGVHMFIVGLGLAPFSINPSH